jgi:hypothetical protein
MSIEEKDVSALEENISRKGTNAYYYAHSKKMDGPVWDGKEEPRLLASTPLTSGQKEYVTPLDTFSWMDDDKFVKIIIEHEGVGIVPDENISIVSSFYLFFKRRIILFLLFFSKTTTIL